MNFYEREPVSIYLSDLTLLSDVNSTCQNIKVYNHPILGKVMIINNEIQTVEKWVPLYHEAITHIPMMFIENPKSVLILGGGDLFAAEIVLKYPTVERVIICDHDPQVIDITDRFYRHANNVIHDSRVHFEFCDAKEYIDLTTEKFDLIIDDCFNLITDFGEEENIFNKLSNLLNSELSVCCSLMYRHIFDKYILSETKRRLFQKHKTILSMITVPEYPGILHLLTMWGNSKYLKQDLAASNNLWHKECISLQIECGEWFNPIYCNFYLYLPNYIKKLLRG